MGIAMKTINVAGWSGKEGLGFTATESVSEKKADKKNAQMKNGSIFAGNVNSMRNDRIARKQEQARKQAAKAISDQFARDNEITDSMNELRTRNQEINQEIADLREQEEWLRSGQEALKEKYGITDDSQEQKDLELIRKANKALDNGQLGTLSKEELDRIADMGELTEYQRRSLEYDEIIENNGFERKTEGLLLERSGNTYSINSTKLNSVKNRGMLKAAKAAEAILDAASDEIRGMLWEDAKEHVDKEMEELIEAAKEEAEKKEAEEEKLDAAKAEKEEQKELTEEMQESVSEQDKLQQEVDKILKEAELLKEEMKGLLVDEIL